MVPKLGGAPLRKGGYHTGGGGVTPPKLSWKRLWKDSEGNKIMILSTHKGFGNHWLNTRWFCSQIYLQINRKNECKIRENNLLDCRHTEQINFTATIESWMQLGPVTQRCLSYTRNETQWFRDRRDKTTVGRSQEKLHAAFKDPVWLVNVMSCRKTDKPKLATPLMTPKKVYSNMTTESSVNQVNVSLNKERIKRKIWSSLSSFITTGQDCIWPQLVKYSACPAKHTTDYN